jgi:hypothetical protein
LVLLLPLPTLLLVLLLLLPVQQWMGKGRQAPLAVDAPVCRCRRSTAKLEKPLSS